MIKIPLPLICFAAILGLLLNNFLFYQDVFFDRHGGAIMMGFYANTAVFLSVVFTIFFILVACGYIATKHVQPYIFDPEVTRNRLLGKINAHLADIAGNLDDQAQENKEVRGFIEYVKKEVGSLR